MARGSYLLSVASRFSAVLATNIQAATSAGASEGFKGESPILMSSLAAVGSAVARSVVWALGSWLASALGSGSAAALGSGSARHVRRQQRWRRSQGGPACASGR